MKPVYFEMSDWEQAASGDKNSQYTSVSEPLTAENSAAFADAEIISTFIHSDLSAKVLVNLKALKIIATRSTGYDHIDLDYCNKNKIAVANVPTYGEHTVAEHVFALLLTLSHNIPQAMQRTKKGDFSLTGLQGFDLYQKTIGIVGMGSIGVRVAKIALAFGMNVVGFDISPQPELAAIAGFSYVSLKDLLAQSDIITLHVPGGVATSYMLSDDEFGMMKDGVVIINTARGSLINLKSLLKGLHDGKVFAAGLDVLPDEPLIREETELLCHSFVQKHDLESFAISHALLNHDRVAITPHSAFYTREALERMLATTQGNIAGFLNGRAQNIVGMTPLPGAYPLQWDKTTVLPNGKNIQLRPIQPDDSILYKKFMRLSSAEDIRNRFFESLHELPRGMASDLSHIDYTSIMAFVSIDPENSELLGVSRYVVDPKLNRAEFSVMTRSDVQSEGIGTSLMRALLEYGKRKNLASLWGQIMHSNTGMIKLCRDLGFSIDMDESDRNCVVATIDLS